MVFDAFSPETPSDRIPHAPCRCCRRMTDCDDLDPHGRCPDCVPTPALALDAVLAADPVFVARCDLRAVASVDHQLAAETRDARQVA